MKPLLTAMACGAFLIFTDVAAQAQFLANVNNDQLAFESDIARITLAFRAPVRSVQADAAADSAVMEGARRNLYDQIRAECATLAQSFPNSQCRLGSIDMLSIPLELAPPNNNGMPSVPSVTATAVFYLKLKR